VIKPALIYSATGVVLVHNHPAGQPIPSEEDLTITRELEKVMALVGAAPFRCGLIGYHLKLDSILS
jgi:DNA repair protein RadC